MDSFCQIVFSVLSLVMLNLSLLNTICSFWWSVIFPSACMTSADVYLGAFIDLIFDMIVANNAIDCVQMFFPFTAS